MKTILAFLKDLFPEWEQGCIFLVGGCVRDTLLGRHGTDIDLVAALSADVVASRGFHPVQGRSGIPIWFKYVPEIGKIELVLLPNSSGLSTELVRRDFTVNAMAMDLAGKVTDPLNGRQDLVDRVLRACSPSTFLDDPLRIFRAFRFEAEGWRMTTGSELLIRDRSWHEMLTRIPVERFTREMIKAASGNEPARFFQRMLEFRVGDTYVPEIFRMPSIPAGPPAYHPEGDLFTHSIQVLERVAATTPLPLPRFCAMFHDLGKLATDPGTYPHHHGHEEAGFSLARPFCTKLRLPAAYRTALAWVCRLHGKANRWGELRDATKLKIGEQAIKAGISEILPWVALADKPDGIELASWERVVRIAAMNTAELGIDPHKLNTMEPAIRAGHILHQRVERLRQSQY